MEEDIKILEDMLNKESSIYKRNRRGNKEIKFEVNSNYYNAIKNLLKEYKKVKEGRDWYFKHTVNELVTPEMLHKILRQEYIPKSKVKEKLEELDKRIDFLNTELTKCYIEREKLGTETDIDNNETYIFYMEEEKNFREKQKEILQELLGKE